MYWKIENNLMNQSNKTLNLGKIIQLFPNCQYITIRDGYRYPLIPLETEYKNTILGVIDTCLNYIKPKKDQKGSKKGLTTV